MKLNFIRTALPAALLSWLLSVSAAGCLSTAFDLPLLHGIGRIFLLCGLFAVAVSLTFHFSRTAIPITLLLASQLALLYAIRQQSLQMPTLLPSVTTYYHKAYGWPILLKNAPTEVYADLALLQLTLVICFFLCWMLTRRKNLFLCLLPLSPLLCCAVVFDTVPDGAYLCPLLLGLLLLLLTHHLRRQKQDAWGKQSLRLIPAAALFLALLFVLVPVSDTLNPLRTYADKLAPRIEQLLSQNSPLGIVGVSTDKTVNFSAVGPKVQSNATVLYATSTEGGFIYLRHKSMTKYTGTSWQPLMTLDETFGSDSYADSGSILIETRRALPFRYMPYYPAEVFSVSEGILPNSSGETVYRYPLADTCHATGDVSSSHSPYQNLPNSTLAWAKPLASRVIGTSTAPADIAARIAEYVQNAASYSLQTPRMPAATKDFAKWFLEDSDTGYCVHFATAATVLLRAAGVSARYAEGLAFRANADRRVAVTNANAHAWVEYYDTDAHTWRILDPTPAEGIPDDRPVVGPDTPDTPDGPDTPEVPDDPDTPDLPEGPDTPDTPDDPDGPAMPDTPKLPDMTPGDGAKPGLWARIRQLPAYAFAGAAILVLIAALWLQALLRCRLNRRRWSRGAPNVQALERFRQCSLLARACRLPLPEALTELAGKARFSQYTLTEEELACFDQFRTDTLARAKRGPRYCKLLYRLLFAVG